MLLDVVIFLLSVVGTASALRCRCLPDQPCWPNDDAWAAFNKNLSQPTTRLRPLASICYEKSDNFDQSACESVRAGFTSSPFRLQFPDTSQFTVWEQIITNTSTFECPPNPASSTDVCFQGRVPVVSVNASSVQDIQETVRFASQHNLKLTIKNTGHELLGRSLGVGSLSLWTHNMQNITFEPTFHPQGAPAPANTSQAFTIGPGVTWGQLYVAAHKQNRTVVGGIGAGGSVGAGGGWILGAGHSILTPYHGLGIDNVLQFTVVLPNASHVTANAYTNPDLFWALKGGGGPSFGILTSTTYITHDAPPITAAFYTSAFNTSEARSAIISLLTSMNVAFVDSGWSGFWPYDNQSLSLTFIALGDPPTNPRALSTYAAFVNASAALPGVEVTLDVLKPYLGFFEWYEDNFINSANGIGYNYTLGDIVGVPISSGSRLIPRETFENNASALSAAFADFPAARPFMVGGGILPSIDPDSVSSTPAWRTMIADVALALSWPPDATAETIAAARQNTTAHLNTFRALTPNSGAYLNEGDILEVGWQQAYWGDHYPRLQAIKKKVDPDELLIVLKGVNSEPWDDEQNCRID